MGDPFMKRLKVKLIFVIPIIFLGLICAFFLYSFLYGPYQYYNFNHQKENYYASLANACDSVIQNHPVGTNRFVGIATTDVSLPREILVLHPVKMQVYSGGIWILHGGRLKFGINWEQNQSQTNQWVLSSTLESKIINLYNTNR
jgi:hypothetical protein